MDESDDRDPPGIDHSTFDDVEDIDDPELLERTFAVTSGIVDVTSLRDAQARRYRPSRWGRLDLAIAWRRVERIRATELQTTVASGAESRRGELWVLLTWRN